MYHAWARAGPHSHPYLQKSSGASTIFDFLTSAVRNSNRQGCNWAIASDIGATVRDEGVGYDYSVWFLLLVLVWRHVPVIAVRRLTSPALRSFMPREGLGSSITALNDQLLWLIYSYLPREQMCPEAVLKQFWHMPFLNSWSLLLFSISSVLVQSTITASFYYLPKSRDPIQVSSLLLEILHAKGE